MTRRMLAVALAGAILALSLAAAPRVEAVSFVDKQVQAGGLLLQSYINAYGQAHQFVYPPKSMVKKGGGLPNSKLIWPANPWTGKVMGAGTSRGTYTYKLAADRRSYKLTMHFSRGTFVVKGGMPAWFKVERDTASQHNALLLQRYLQAYRLSGDYPVTLDEASFPSSQYAWPANPWTGTATVAGDSLGEFSYARSGGGYALRIKLTTGWSRVLGPLL